MNTYTQGTEATVWEESGTGFGNMTPEEMAAMIRRLQAQRCELEEENETLRHTVNELFASKNDLETVIYKSTNAYILLNGFRRLTDLNNAFCKMTGYSAGELHGKHITDFIAEDDRNTFLHWMRGLQSDIAGQPVDLKLQTKAETFIPVKFNIVAEAAVDINHLIIAVKPLVTPKDVTGSVAPVEFCHSGKALEVSNIGSWELGIDTWTVTVSEVTKKIFGLKKSDTIIDYKYAEQLVHPDDRSNNGFQLEPFLRDDSVFQSEFRIIRENDGEIRRVKFIAGLVRDAGGNPVIVIGTVQDVTDSWMMRQALKESEERHSIISDLITDYIYRIKPDDNGSQVYEWLNKGLAAIYGYNKSELTKLEEIEQIIHPDDRHLFRNRMETLKNGSETIFEYRIVDKSGNQRLIRDYARPVRNGSSSNYSVYGALQDITWQKAAEHALHHSHLRLRSIFDTIPGSICVVDKDLNITDVNHNFLELHGYSDRNEVTGKKFCESISGEMVCTEMAAMKEVIDSGTPSTRISIEGEYAGNDKIFKIYSNPVIDDNDVTIGAINIYTDITDLKNAETKLINLITELKTSKATIEKQLEEINQINTQLSRSEENLRQINLTKDKFFSIIAHDLRNPLNGFINYSEMLFNDISNLSDEEIRDLSQSMNNSAKHLFRLLENLLEWSRAQSGKIEFQPVKLNLNELVFDNCYFIKKMTAKKNQELEPVYCDKPIVFADYNMIDTIIRNLLSNAVKFTPQNGRIEVKVCEEADKVRFSVSDSGIGIGKADVEKLFSLDKSTRRQGTDNEKGTGLGLLIIKEFIEKHNSRIEVQSTEGKGSVFSFCLDRYCGEETENEEPAV